MVAVVPFLLLAVLVAAQLGLAGQALWSAGLRRALARGRRWSGATRGGARGALPGVFAPGAR